MTKRRRRRARVTKPPVEEEILEDEDLEEDEEDFEEEEEAPKPKPRRRRRKKVVEPPDDDEEEEEDEEPAPAPKKKTTRRRRKKVEPEPEVVEEAEVDSETLLEILLDSLDEGNSLTITSTGRGTYAVSLGGKVQAGLQLKGKAFWDEVLDPDFQEFSDEWSQMTFEEKKARAKKLKAKWQEHEDPRTEAMRIKPAVCEVLGLSKYKEQYQSRAARAAIKAS